MLRPLKRCSKPLAASSFFSTKVGFLPQRGERIINKETYVLQRLFVFEKLSYF